MDEPRLDILLGYLDEKPGDAFCQYAIALEYLKLGKQDKAEHYLVNLLSLHPAYLAAYYQLGKIAESKGKKTEAIEWYKKGILIAGDQQNAHTLSELRNACDSLEED